MAEFFEESKIYLPCPSCFGNGWLVIPSAAQALLSGRENPEKKTESPVLHRAVCPHCQGLGKMAAY